MSDDNIWTDEWDEGEDWSGGGSKSKRLPRTERLGATVPDRSAGAHGFRNDGEGKCRYLVASTRQAPEVAEYPELGQITAQAPTASQTGERLWLVYDVPKDE